MERIINKIKGVFFRLSDETLRPCRAQNDVTHCRQALLCRQGINNFCNCKLAAILFMIIMILILGFSNPAKAEGFTDLSNLITAQNIKYQDCTKVFNTNNVHLLYLTISAINANRFQIDEIQSKMGYVLFTAVNKQFLASVSNVNTSQGMLKITPVDGRYYFQPGIIMNIYKYININLNTPLEKI